MQQFKGTILLNELAVFIWKKIQFPVTIDDLVVAILEEYQAEKEQVEYDVKEIINIFTSYNVIEHIWIVLNANFNVKPI